MLIDLNVNEIYMVLDCVESKMSDLSILRFCGGDFGDSVTTLIYELSLVKDKLEEELLPFGSISAADVEANSQDAAAAISKRTASDLDQREAGDEVSLDQHIQLYKEVF